MIPSLRPENNTVTRFNFQLLTEERDQDDKNCQPSNYYYLEGLKNSDLQILHASLDDQIEAWGECDPYYGRGLTDSCIAEFQTYINLIIAPDCALTAQRRFVVSATLPLRDYVQG